MGVVEEQMLRAGFRAGNAQEVKSRLPVSPMPEDFDSENLPWLVGAGKSPYESTSNVRDKRSTTD